MAQDTSRVQRIAMWSGPRNISTALMRSFENRGDCFVSDEPFYACYLATTGLQHPGLAEILRHHETDWDRVVQHLTGPTPEGQSVWYQKQMAHHMLPGHDREWMYRDDFQHVFLIRAPQQMLLSLSKVLGQVDVAQTGLPQQVELFRSIEQRTGRRPLVLDSRDVLADPAVAMQQLCERLGLDFRPSMLSWPTGPRSTDGIWAPHWYSRVYETTGFAADVVRDEPLPDHCVAILSECEALYAQLAAAI